MGRVGLEPRPRDYETLIASGARRDTASGRAFRSRRGLGAEPRPPEAFSGSEALPAGGVVSQRLATQRFDQVVLPLASGWDEGTDAAMLRRRLTRFVAAVPSEIATRTAGVIQILRCSGTVRSATTMMTTPIPTPTTALAMTLRTARRPMICWLIGAGYARCTSAAQRFDRSSDRGREQHVRWGAPPGPGYDLDQAGTVRSPARRVVAADRASRSRRGPGAEPRPPEAGSGS